MTAPNMALPPSLPLCPKSPPSHLTGPTAVPPPSNPPSQGSTEIAGKRKSDRVAPSSASDPGKASRSCRIKAKSSRVAPRGLALFRAAPFPPHLPHTLSQPLESPTAHHPGLLCLERWQRPPPPTFFICLPGPPSAGLPGDHHLLREAVPNSSGYSVNTLHLSIRVSVVISVRLALAPPSLTPTETEAPRSGHLLP